MFDKLIESDGNAADLRTRRNYFMISSLVVGLLFLSAVIFSIYAADIDLGNDEFELTTLLPPAIAETPEPMRPEIKTNTAQSGQAPNVHNAVLPINETPATQPVSTSVVPNTETVLPEGQFTRNFNLPESTGAYDPSASGTSSPKADGTGSDDGSAINESDSKPKEIPKPPPITTKSLGVINGIAIDLPKPPYPAIAAQINLQGKVDVQVTIDETGKVISAKAVNGHPFLRGPAEKAAWKARFSPTYLSKVAVKVTGVIVYKFSRN